MAGWVCNMTCPAHRLAACAVLFLLAACGGGPPIPQPAPHPTPNPSVLEYTADLANFHVGLACTEDVPPLCHGDAEWLTFDRPGSEGQACTVGNPNPCWEVVYDQLRLHTGPPGFPLFTNRTFDRGQKITVEAVLSAECLTQGCYAGPVIYNGEGNYRAIYFAWAPNGIQAHMYGPTFETPLSATIYQPGTVHTFHMTYDAGVWTYAVDGRVELTESAGLSQDSPILTHDPHLSVFIGDATATLQSLKVFYGPG